VHLKNLKVLGKKSLFVLSILSIVFLIAGSAFAGDDRALAGQSITISSLPVLVSGEYGTDFDNENNAHTGTADGDMDYYIYNDESIHPIEFNINVPVTNASARSATLRMDVYDVDTSTIPGDPEIDDVYVNGSYVGTLNGSNGTWGVNIFNIPIGVLKTGKNLVQINVDTASSGWAVQVDWGIIKLASATGAQISKAWFTPITVTRGNYINAFAEISDPSNKISKVQVYKGSTLLFTLTDPDEDSTWSGQYKIPAGWTVGWKQDLTIVARNATGAILSRWPGINVK
jgi:hypothetical protein